MIRQIKLVMILVVPAQNHNVSKAAQYKCHRWGFAFGTLDFFMIFFNK